MRLIDADALLRHLNDMWLGATPSDTDTEETAKERRAICMGIDDCIGAVRAFPNADEWISVKDRLPVETHSIFYPFSGTKKWQNAMWREQSDKVLVTVAFKDGTKMVATGETHDCVWNTTISRTIEPVVTHWMPLPEPPEEGT